MTEGSAPEDASVTFHVKSAGGAKYTLTLPLSTTAIDLKNKLATEEYANVPASAQRLIYSGKVLKDGDTLATHSVKEGNTMHLVKSAASNQRQNPAAQQSTPNAGSTNSTPQVAGVPQNLASGTGNDPLAGLTGARYAGFTQLPSASMFQNPPSQEEMIRQLQDPNFAQMMREAMNNPQFIDMMVNSHPQLRAMGPQARQMLQSDQFRRMMTDPEVIRSMMQMQQMFGGGSGGMGGQEAFPAPGSTNTTETQSTQNQQQQMPQNPFAALGGNMGANPFGSMFGFPPPTQNTQQPAQGTNNAENESSNTQGQQAQNANPFAALFNPAMFGGQAQTGAGAENTSDASSQPPNRFATNPSLGANTFQQNPEAARNAMQNLMQALGQGGNMQQPNWLDQLGGFGGPPDNRRPEERYATQLRQLNEMGFHDFDLNIQALSRSGGDVNGALEYLFSHT
jgi:ubiquilin